MLMMDSSRENLLTFGFVRDYCEQNNIDFPPDDIVGLFVSWLILCDRFVFKLSHKNIEITTETHDKYGECQQIKKSKDCHKPSVTAIGEGIYKKGDKQSWTFAMGPSTWLVIGIIEDMGYF